ncbi:MAG: M48 family metallopeptidase [Deltaproteobacteria bacterium]|nr:M48 family metallopeptidase [Deltaproteobacteria bacterium]
MALRVTANMPETPSLRLVVVNTRLDNAFALPGDIVVLTKGLIDNARSAEEVAGVIAHEIGHIHYDHPIQGLYRTAAVSIVVGLVTGDVAGGILITGLGRWVLNSGYSRIAERQADDYALERLYAAGIDSKGFEEFFTRALAEQAKGEGALSGFLSTHPLTRERIETVRRAPRAAGKVFGGDHHLEWRRLRLICWSTRAAPSPIRIR